MKLTLPWLLEHLATEASLDEIVAKLTMLGLEVEAVESRGADLTPFRVAVVTEVRPHPNAERLSLCRVDAGGEAALGGLRGAQRACRDEGRVRAGRDADPGTGQVLRRAQIRGVESAGMLCSAAELLLGDGSRRHHRAAGRRAGRPAGRRGDPDRGPADRGRGDAEPERLLRRARDRARARGRRARHAAVARFRARSERVRAGLRISLASRRARGRPARCSSAGSCAACATARARPGCRSG